jgi:hypothetical protein
MTSAHVDEGRDRQRFGSGCPVGNSLGEGHLGELSGLAEVLPQGQHGHAGLGSGPLRSGSSHPEDTPQVGARPPQVAGDRPTFEEITQQSTTERARTQPSCWRSSSMAKAPARISEGRCPIP